MKLDKNPLAKIDLSIPKGNRWLSLLFSIFVTILIFLLLPFMQTLKEDSKGLFKVREVEYLEVPPEPIEEVVIEEDIIQEEPPEFEEAPREIQLDDLEFSLNTKPESMMGSLGLGQFQLKNLDASQLVFQLGDLDVKPRVLKQGRLEHPKSMKRKGINGRVDLLVRIDFNGRLKVVKVLSSTNKAFVAPAIKCAEGTLYAPPQKGGIAVTTEFRQPVVFKLPKK